MSKVLFSVEGYKKHLEIATIAHRKQKTPMGIPYTYHISCVTIEVINSLMYSDLSTKEADISIACALMHDVKEDTKFNLEDPELCIDFLILDGVDALTKKDTSHLTKLEKMEDSLKRLLLLPTYIQMVKLADRITNLDKPPEKWSLEKKKIYLEEAKLIHKTLKHSNKYLADKLLDKINFYHNYM